MKSDLYVMSINRPWAYFISGHIPQGIFAPLPHLKTIENRSWKPSQKWIGAYFALHATKNEDKSAYDWIERKFGVALPASGWRSGGEIVAVGRLARATNDPETLTDDQRMWFVGPWGWVFENIRPIPPLIYRGHQGVRKAQGDILEAVRMAYADAIRE